MLVEIEGRWINPNNITQIFDQAPSCGYRIMFVGTAINGSCDLHLLNAEKAALEINRQIKENEKE